jgi:hypothetical protein
MTPLVYKIQLMNDERCATQECCQQPTTSGNLLVVGCCGSWVAHLPYGALYTLEFVLSTTTPACRTCSAWHMAMFVVCVCIAVATCVESSFECATCLSVPDLYRTRAACAAATGVLSSCT